MFKLWIVYALAGWIFGNGLCKIRTSNTLPKYIMCILEIIGPTIALILYNYLD